MISRKVFRVHKKGSISAMQLEHEPLDSVSAEEVCVQVKSIGLNFADIFAIQGLYSATPKGSFVPGLEFSGEILAVGSHVSNWKAGDRVMGVTRFGGYVSHINIHNNYIVRLPDDWSFDEGAAFLVQGLTAYYALRELGNLQRGMHVLIHSAAGGVGILANRICKKYDAFTIGTVSRRQKVEFLKQQEDFNEVIIRDTHFSANLQSALNGRPLDLVMECIGGHILKEGWKALAPMGRMVVYGNASFATHADRPQWLKLLWNYLRRPKIDTLRFPTENKSLMGFNLIYLYENANLMHHMLRELHALDLKPQHVGHVYSFNEMHTAIRHFQRGETIGKVVVRV